MLQQRLQHRLLQLHLQLLSSSGSSREPLLQQLLLALQKLLQGYQLGRLLQQKLLYLPQQM